MRKINIKKFHQNMWKELEDLPVVVTIRGKPVFTAKVFDEYEDTKADPKEVLKKLEERNL